MFRATNSPIVRSTFECIYTFWYNTSTMLPADAAVEMVPVGSIIGALYQKLHIQSEVLLTMGEFVARNM